MQTCRGCNHYPLSPIIDLGLMPLANDFNDGETCSRYPLAVELCSACGLAQLSHVCAPEALFSKYCYQSSCASTMLKSASDLVSRVKGTLTKKDLVVEIASNDGYLLKYYLETPAKVLGIEPASNIAEISLTQGIETWVAFFNEALAREIVGVKGQACVIHANNVLAHIPDIHGALSGCALLLSRQGQLIIEVPYLIDFIEGLQFDTIYHEHVFYFSLEALDHLFAAHDLEVFDVEHLSLHGGSLRLFVGHRHERVISDAVVALREKEKIFDLRNLQHYEIFNQKIELLKSTLIEKIREEHSKGRRVAAYGASAKGTILLNALRIGCEELRFIVDKNPLKIGKYAPGTGLPIYAPEKLLSESIDVGLLLAWNFKEEIAKEQSVFLSRGGCFLLPQLSLKKYP